MKTRSNHHASLACPVAGGGARWSAGGTSRRGGLGQCKSSTAGGFGNCGRVFFVPSGRVQTATVLGRASLPRRARGDVGQGASVLRRPFSAASLPNKSFQRTVKKLRFLSSAEFKR